MPIYEYYCEACHGVFELLRTVDRASEPGQCPVCDAEARRIMSTEFEAFTFRDGAPRHIPDRGTYLHFGKEVSSPITKTALPGEHPELAFDKHGPGTPPTVEELEQFQEQMTEQLEQQAEKVASGKPPIVDTYQEHHTGEFVKRVQKTLGQARLKKVRQPNAKVTPRTRSGEHQSGRTGAEPRSGSAR